jgi:hypothetical protein
MDMVRQYHPAKDPFRGCEKNRIPYYKMVGGKRRGNTMRKNRKNRKASRKNRKAGTRKNRRN